MRLPVFQGFVCPPPTFDVGVGFAPIPAVKSVLSVETKPVVEKKEALVTQKETTADFEAMTKSQLETYGRTIGLELDKRHNKAELIAEIQKFTSAN